MSRRLSGPCTDEFLDGREAISEHDESTDEDDSGKSRTTQHDLDVVIAATRGSTAGAQPFENGQGQKQMAILAGASDLINGLEKAMDGDR